MRFRKFILARDNMGVPFSIRYKGADTFQTMIGAILTLCIRVLVISQCFMLFLDMVQMSDPLVRSYERPLYR